MLTVFMTVLTGLAANGTRLDIPQAHCATTDEKPRELKVIAKYAGSPGAVRGHTTIRGGQELAKITVGIGANIDKATSRMAKLLKVKTINWKKQMLLVINGGAQRTGGYRVEVTSLKVKGDELTVHWKLIGPRPGQPVTQAISHPALTLLVERYDDTIYFDPASPQSGLKDR